MNAVFLPITLTITDFISAFPIPLEILHLYRPSSVFDTDSSSKLPFGNTTAPFETETGTKSELSPEKQ